MTAPDRRHVFELSVTLESPFLTQGMLRSVFGCDAAQAVDGAGRAILPQDLIKGNLRQAVCDLARHAPGSGADLDMVAELFGRPSPEQGSAGSLNEPRRGRLIFSDLVGPVIRDKDGAPLRPDLSVRIAIDGETGSVKSGALQVVEMPFPVGSMVTFSGRLALVCPPDRTAVYERVLRRALALIPALGAFKTAGFGRVAGATLVPLVAAEAAAPKLPDGNRLIVALRLDRPLIVDAERVADNVFRSSTVIPGAAVKGCLAEAMRRAGDDPERDSALSRLTIGHAFPCREGEEASPHEPLPLSLVSFPADGSWDVVDWLGRSDPPVRGNAAGAFQIDWKGEVYAKARAACGWPEWFDLRPDVRVHTAIDSTTGAAAEGQLFSHTAYRPDGVVWRGLIDGQAVEPAAFRRMMAVLANGLDGLGKTGARAEVTLSSAPPVTVRPRAKPGGPSQWAVTLRTPALLTDPGQGGVDYAAYWHQASDGALRLVRHYALQTLAGGYIAMRRRLQGGTYAPFLLTNAGSTFLLEGDGEALLKTWASAGLPARGGFGPDDWRRCPYLPENGYGAIAVNHNTPAAEGCHV